MYYQNVKNEKPTIDLIDKELRNSKFQDDIDCDVFNILKDAGATIKRIRKIKNISQKQLSELTGISQANISKIECGKYNMSFKQFNKMMCALDIKWKIEVE